MKDQNGSGYIVTIHGIWMNGSEMGLLARRLSAAGYQIVPFRHKTIFGDFATTVRELNAEVERIRRQSPESSIHFVAHSLGGVLVRHWLAEYQPEPVGRVVTLGTPHRGSGVARALGQRGIDKFLLGSSRQPLQGEPQPLPEGWQLGSIAGTRSFGMGRLLPGLEQPNDGTVALGETHCQGERDHFTLNSSHFGLLINPTVAEQVLHFLNYGKFSWAGR